MNEKIMCDINSRANQSNTGEASPLSTDGRTFIAQGTGSVNDSLNAFIYAPSSTFVSAGVAKSSLNNGQQQRTQDHYNRHNYAVVNKGGYLKVARRNSATSATIYNLLNEKGEQISAIDAKRNGHYYTGVGEKIRNNMPQDAISNPIYIPDYTILRHNLRTGKITTHGLELKPGSSGRPNTAQVKVLQRFLYTTKTTKQVCQNIRTRCQKSYTWRCNRRVPYTCYRPYYYRCRRYRYYGWYSYWYWSTCRYNRRSTCYRYQRYCTYNYWTTCTKQQCSNKTVTNDIDLMQTEFSESSYAQAYTNLNKYYNINLMGMYNNSDIDSAPRRFKGAVWARNVCFSREYANRASRQDWIRVGRSHTWDFNGDFIDKIVDRYGDEYDFGLPEYRAHNETLIDPQRNLSK